MIITSSTSTESGAYSPLHVRLGTVYIRDVCLTRWTSRPLQFRSLSVLVRTINPFNIFVTSRTTSSPVTLPPSTHSPSPKLGFQPRTLWIQTSSLDSSRVWKVARLSLAWKQSSKLHTVKATAVPNQPVKPCTFAQWGNGWTANPIAAWYPMRWAHSAPEGSRE